MKAPATALALLALVLASCGDDDDKSDKKPAGDGSAKKALFTAGELAPKIESDIVRRAKKEDREAGNDPSDYTYKAKCLPRSGQKLACRLDLTGKDGKSVNTVAYRANFDPDSGEFGYKVTSNQDTRPAGR